MLIFTGFKPFLGQKTNSSWELAQDLAKEFPISIALELPVEFHNSFLQLKQYIDSLENFPEKIFLLGQSGGRSHLSIERVALNWLECEFSDERGFLPKPGKIDDTGPTAYIQEHLKPLAKNDVKISHSAGTYVCNELYYRCLKYWERWQKRIVFIHTPLLEPSEEITEGTGRDICEERVQEVSRETEVIVREINDEIVEKRSSKYWLKRSEQKEIILDWILNHQGL